MKPEEMTAVQERRFRKSVDYFRKNREIYVRRIKKILEEYKNALAAEKADEDVDVLQLSEAFSLKSLIPDKVYNMSASATPFSFPPTPMSDASLFSPWPMMGMDTSMNDNQFSFTLPGTPLSLPVTTPDSSVSAAAAAFGYNNYQMSPFYPNVTAFCGCADCIGKSNMEIANSAYHGLYASDDSTSTLQKSIPSSASHQKDDSTRGLNSASQYPSRDSAELDTEAQFDFQSFYSTANNNNASGSENANASCAGESFSMSPSNSEKKTNSEQGGGDAGIDSQSSKGAQQKSTYPTDNRTPFAGLSGDSIDYYASMNSFPNSHNLNTTSLFPNYNRAVIGAGDSGALGFRGTNSDQGCQSASTSMSFSVSQDLSGAHQPIMMYNNTSSYALPYMSWSQGDHLMMPTVFTPTPNSALDANAPFPAGMQPIQAAPSIVGQPLFSTGKERPQGHDEHNPDYSNCFPSSNPNVSNAGHESY